ncbi:hypothetical protein H4S02_001063 [Coemansia sp. RSA 2611]|nr:hypothetical protein H4S02_001063 [Coemansia sp. RSA 2611]
MVRTICNVDSATATHLLLIDNARKSRGEVGEVYLNESDFLHEDIAPQEGVLLLVDGSFEQGSRYYEALAWEQAILREIANRQGGQNNQAAQHEAAKL